MAKNILVIDDDGLVSRSLCQLLTSNGFHADSREGAQELFDEIFSRHIDLMVVDIMMPQINGVALVKQIKEYLQAHHRKDIPVVFITGFPDSPEAQEARALGLVLAKPFENDDLLHVLANFF